MKTSNDNSDIIPSLSLSRRPGPPKKSLSTSSKTKEKNRGVKRPCIPIPSFQAERENLEKIFNDDSSSEESPPPKKKKKSTKKRTRPYIPIPSFSNSDDDGLDDEDILNTKPIFASDSRKPKVSSVDSEKSVAPKVAAVVSNDNSGRETTQSKETEWSNTVSNLAVDNISADSNEKSKSIETNLNYSDEQAKQIETNISENEVMQLAVGIARSLDPANFSFKQVQNELQVQTGDAWKLVKLPKLRQFILQQLEPAEEALHAAIDSVFLQIDVQSSTKKQFIAKVQDMFPIPFSQLCRSKITRRLTSLLNKELSPTVVAMVSHAATENEKKPLNGGDCQAVPDVLVESIEEERASPSNDAPSLDGTANAPIDRQNDKCKQTCESNEDEIERMKPLTGIPELQQGPVRDRGDKTVADARKTRLSSSKEKKLSKSIRKPPQVSNSEINLAEDNSKEHSSIEKMPRKQKGACQLCANCPCSLSIDQPTTAPVFSEKHSNATVEKNLIKRLQKLEKIADYYEEQTESVRRMLKKHRREIWKKRESSLSDNGSVSRPRFLPDAGELGEVMDSIKPRAKLGSEKARKAQLAVFAHAPAAVAQATLTQLLCVSKTKSRPVLENSLDDIAEETEVDLKDETLPASDDDDNDEASVASVASGDENYFTSKPVPFSRLECRNGQECMQSPAKDGGSNKSVWISMLTGRFSQCLASLTENLEDADECSTMDNLVEMIDGSSVEEIQSSVNRSDSVEFSMLSQRGQTIAQSLIQETDHDPKLSSTFRRHCPQWKENILYALHQRDTDDIVAGLKELRSAKSNLSQKKALLLQTIEERTDLLNLYENALEMSLSRFSCGDAETNNQNCSILSPVNPKDTARLSLISEAPTLQFTASQCGLSSPLSIASR